MAGNMLKNESFHEFTIISKSLKTKFKGNTLGDKYKKYKKGVKFPSLVCLQIPLKKNIVKLLVWPSKDSVSVNKHLRRGT